MARIRVVIDEKTRWHPAGLDVWRVTNEDEYYAARRRIRDAMKGTQSVVVWVTNPQLGTWFNDLSEEEEVEIFVYNVLQQLADALGVSVDTLPLIVDEQLCEQQDLIARAHSNPPHQNESITSWVLRTTLGEPWGKPCVAPHTVGQALTALAKCHAISEGLERLVVKQLHKWSQGQVAPKMWAWLEEDCVRRARCILTCWATKGYGEVQRNWLAQEGYTPEETQSALQLLQEIDTLQIQREPSVSYRLRQIMKAELADCISHNGVRALQAATSRLQEEIMALMEYLTTRAEDGQLLSPDESDCISDWIKPCRSTAAGQQVHIMAQLLREASLPRPFPTHGEWQKIKQWLANSYLQAYQCRAVTFRLDEIDEYTAAFEEWLVSNYHQLHMQERIGPHRFINCLADRLKDGVVLLVIVDGVPYLAMQHLLHTMRNTQACAVHEEEMFLSLLPSTTAINKQCILTGELPDHVVTINQDVMAARFNITPQQVITTIIDDSTALANFVFSPEQLYIVHYRAVDQSLLHKPMTPLRRWTQAYVQMEKIGDALGKLFLNATEQGLGLWAGLISDHGWSELPTSAVGVEVPECLLHNIDHGRILLGRADKAYGWALESSKFFLCEPCTLAKGYQYFGRRPQGAVHGGATPQETAILGVWVTNTNVRTVSDLVVQVQDTVMRGHPDNPITLRIINPNEEPIEICEIRLPSFQAKKSFPVKVQRNGYCDLHALCDASSAREDDLILSGNIIWDIKGQRHIQPVVLRIPTMGAAKANRSFEDMFQV